MNFQTDDIILLSKNVRSNLDLLQQTIGIFSEQTFEVSKHFDEMCVVGLISTITRFSEDILISNEYLQI